MRVFQNKKILCEKKSPLRWWKNQNNFQGIISICSEGGDNEFPYFPVGVPLHWIKPPTKLQFTFVSLSVFLCWPVCTLHAEMGASCHLSFVLHSCPWRRIFGQCHLLCFVCALNLSFPQSCWSLNDLCGGCNCAASALSSSLKRTEGSCFSKEVHLSNWTFDEWQNDQTFDFGPKAWHLDI